MASDTTASTADTGAVAPAPAPRSAIIQPSGSFRDSIPTADQEGRRKWIYPRKPEGRFYRARTWVAWALLAILFAGPFIRINGNPLLLFNVVERKFSIFGQVFWPQDFYLFALALLTIFIMIVLFTAVFGRLWCGWLCPQTVFMEMVFRKIEYWLEGDALEQRRLRSAPWTGRKAARKLAKHVLFFALSFLVGNLLLAYIIGSDALIAIVTDDPREHVNGLTAMVLFALLFYGIFARFREQACTFICPYGRFQSVLLDEHSLVVSYDFKRGDPRQRFSRKQAHGERRAAGTGDCIDCRLCVEVCPTGIDIRNGTQMECVHCTACIDACDSVMDRIGFPRGLVRYASQNGIVSGERLRITPRVAGYCGVLLLLGGFLSVLLASRRDVDTSLLRSPGSLYQVQPDGHVSNLYLLKVVNKTAREVPVELRLEQPAEGRITIAGGSAVAPPRELQQSAAIVAIPPEALKSGRQQAVVGVYSGGRRIQTIKTNFVAPTKAGG
jgi:cytochrome c oxidase accessory protein FixG